MADGYRVLSASNGQAALQLVERTLPRLAIVDLVMPVMDGFDLARRLKRLGRNVVIDGGYSSRLRVTPGGELHRSQAQARKYVYFTVKNGKLITEE